MANEVTGAVSLGFSKGSFTSKVASKSAQFTAVGTNCINGTRTVPTAGESIALGSIGTPGWFCIINNSTTNYIEILDANAGNVLLKIKAGEFAVGRFGVAAPAWKANTAACAVEFLIIED